MPSTFLKLGTKIKARTEINASKKNASQPRLESTISLQKQTLKQKDIHPNTPTNRQPKHSYCIPSSSQYSIPRDALEPVRPLAGHGCHRHNHATHSSSSAATIHISETPSVEHVWLQRGDYRQDRDKTVRWGRRLRSEALVR